MGLTGAQPASMRAGSVLGGIPVARVIGGHVGSGLDITDQVCATESLEHARTGETISWQTASGIPVRFWVTRNYEESGRPCRSFEVTVQTPSGSKISSGAACKMQNGSWEPRG